MGFFQSYKLRIMRRRRLWRAFRRRHNLRSVSFKARNLAKDDILLFCTQRNERLRLPYFLEYYRSIGVNHFFFVDNDSDDGALEYLKEQPDVSIWHTKASYKRARYGVDWLNWLQLRYAHGHWTLVVDADEFLVYPFCDTRPLRALTDWLDASSIKSFGTLVLDMYPKGAIDEQPYAEGQNPFEIASWFDSGNYTHKKNQRFGNLWIQGGPRSRVFFHDAPEKGPALNKIPLVKWERKFAYMSSTHMLLPRGLNQVYDEWGGEKTSGVLLHAKFLDTFTARAAEEAQRKEHYLASAEYAVYSERMQEHPELWCKWSEKYINWRQLEILGLMSKGNWA